jgi:hypothetical protein
MTRRPRLPFTSGLAFAALLLTAFTAPGEPPGVSYIFPAGAQRGKALEARVGGFYFHGNARFQFANGLLQTQPPLAEMQTLFFNGPLILKPASQNREDYPKDYAARISVPADAPLGPHLWRCATSQGVTASMKFVVGDLPELLEQEQEGPQSPVPVRLPVTINGRIFPREDSDGWSFSAQQGETLTCELAARSLGSPLQGVLELLPPGEGKVSELHHSTSQEGDPVLCFTAPQSGTYTVRVRDAAFGGGQPFVYRLSVFKGRPVQSVFPLGGRAGAQAELTLHPLGGGSPEKRLVSLPIAPGIHVLRAPAVGPGEGHLPPSSPFAVHVSDLPERVRPYGAAPGAQPTEACPLPCLLNGCISAPAEAHDWRLQLEAGTSLQLEVLAAVLGSRLDSVLTLLDAEGREVAKNDDATEGAPDSALSFSVPKTGEYVARIQDRFARRSGPDFGYRLRATVGGPADFQLRLAADFYNAIRSEEAGAAAAEPAAKPAPKPPGLKLEVVSAVGVSGPIALEIEGLPEGADFEPKTIPAKAKTAELRFSIPPKTPLSSHFLKIKGTLGAGPAALVRTAVVPGAPFAVQKAREEALLLAVVPRVPFQFFGDYLVNNDQPAGTTLTRSYRLERGGFSGPLTVALSDKQIRCLQRVQAEPRSIAPEASSFDFTIRYPTEVQLGWTSRAQIMVSGSFRDFDGSQHTLTYTSSAPDEQIISVVTSSFLSLSTAHNSLPADSRDLSVPLQIRRHDSIKGVPVRIFLKTPPHIRGVHAETLAVAGDQSEATLHIHVSEGAGPFNLPLEVFAQTDTAGGAALHSGSVRVELTRSGAATDGAPLR